MKGGRRYVRADHGTPPLDGSELAEQALPYAEQLVAAMGGTLHLTRVVEQRAAVRAHGVGAPVNVYEGLIADQRQEATAYLKSRRARGRGRAVGAPAPA